MAVSQADLAQTPLFGVLAVPGIARRRLAKPPGRCRTVKIVCHILRHSAASFLLAAGTHTKVVQEHLGHSSYAITADIYSHVDPAQQREAADRLDQALRW